MVVLPVGKSSPLQSRAFGIGAGVVAVAGAMRSLVWRYHFFYEEKAGQGWKFKRQKENDNSRENGFCPITKYCAFHERERARCYPCNAESNVSSTL